MKLIKKNGMNKKVGLFACMSILAIAGNTAANATPVESMSLEVFNDGERYWEVSVHCEKVSRSRYMRKTAEGGDWCSVDLPTLCNSNKYSLSRRMCRDDFKDQIKAYRANTSKPSPIVTEAQEKAAPAKTSEKADLLKEQLQIEEQRILIRQKRLELEKREIELKKRQVSA